MAKFEDIISGPVPVLVDFHATWCGPCKAMHPILEELKRELGDGVKIVKLDIDKPANRPLAERFSVGSVPTLLIFSNGELIWRRSGVTPSAELAGVIRGLGGR